MEQHCCPHLLTCARLHISQSVLAMLRPGHTPLLLASPSLPPPPLLSPRRQYVTAWHYLTIANALQAPSANYTPDQDWFTVRTLVQSFKGDLPDSGLADSSAVFVVGMPRSGSTLVETMLGSHTQVGGVVLGGVVWRMIAVCRLMRWVAGCVPRPGLRGPCLESLACWCVRCDAAAAS